MADPARVRQGPVGIGLIGAGTISAEYLDNLARFPDTRVVAIGDLRPEVAQGRAAEHAISVSGGPEAVLDHDDVEIVVNLTVPAAHAEVASQAIAAGKHVWNEKPLAADRVAALDLLERAAEAGLRVGCAPDTFLGSGLQAARRLIDQGAIGEPLSALALMQSPGPDAWHPNPAFLFQEGAGPLFDLGPYYLTALVQLFGPIARAAALGSVARSERVVGAGPLAGTTFPVTTPSHVSTILGFASGQSAQAIFSFDSPLPRVLLEVTGTDATLILPDPNRFDGDVCIRRRGASAEEPLMSTTQRSSRGTGVLEMARAIRAGRPHRADGALGFHVLDAMVAVRRSMDEGAFVTVESSVARAEPLPEDWDPMAATLAT
ncbi:MAG TPA: Gfo/Idh/MocA family oxidoreductase [Candidatus Limnocylindrales bacterium]|nr:Gfo/Idh/MocA family oxidoreductase [Candidatus Limnocylindrales bacterium]